MKKLFTFLLAMVLTSTLSGNNIAISNLSLTGKNTGSHYIMVQFDISWDNSWRTSSAPNNWDAAWVFVKYRIAGGAWQHAWLNNVGHTAPTGSTLTPGLLTPGAAFNSTTNPGLGAFIYRSANGNGTNAFTGAQLRWNYGANGVADNAVIDIQVFAIEMVYVPNSDFTVGTNSSESSSFTQANSNSGNTVAFTITSTALTIQGNNASSSASNLSARGNLDLTGTATASLASGFPTGYKAFYCMKYEISQQQYVDFLNTLTSLQASNRYSSANTGSRYGISVSGGVYSTSNPYIACNYLSWMDGAAYSDWAGLRPMTELEYEKACRGTSTPVAGEYAWGNTISTAANNITNGSANNETTNTSDANAVFSNQTNVQGPMRVGVFANGSTIREQAGDTYYGIMEMSGNLLERPVTVGNADGRNFTGRHGNGVLSASGHADVTAWPGLTSGEVTGATGSGLRGGDWFDIADNMRVSDRSLAANTDPSRNANKGFRAVRTKPLDIGDPYQGGIVAYILQPGDPGYDSSMQKGLIAATADQSTGIVWAIPAYQNTFVPGGTFTAIGTGPANTDKIIAQNGAGSTYAAGLARAYAGGGYSDWYLPSKDEIYKLYLNKTAIGGFANNFYFSSTEFNASAAWTQGFTSGNLGATQKAYPYYVRAVRTFPTLPTVTTTAVTSIANTTATSGGNVTSSGENPITARGVCWSTTTGPTVDLTTKTTETGTTGVFTSNITGLTLNTTYYVRAYATSSLGTSYGNEVSFTTTLAIGDAYQGGIVAYILQPGDPGYIAGGTHGLIAATADQSTGIAWITGGATQTTMNGNTSTALGTGQANTNFMIGQTGYTGGAAQVCDDYTNTETGTGVYSDWYLPSKDELNKLYAMKLLGFGGLAYYYYWSSSEFGASYAWGQSFSDGFQGGLNKIFTYKVRAVRAF